MKKRYPLALAAAAALLGGCSPYTSYAPSQQGSDCIAAYEVDPGFTEERTHLGTYCKENAR